MKTAQEYIDAGYRVISRRHRIICRIDREDWVDHMAKDHAPWNVDEGYAWITAMGENHAADQYRRVYSKDKITVSQSILKLIPSSLDMV